MKEMPMKNFTLIFIFSLLTIISTAQNPEFNWQTTELSTDNNLKAMAVNDNEAVIAGYNYSFLKSTNGGEKWDTIDVFNPQYNFPDISIKGNVGYIIAQRKKLYDASPDVYTSGFIMKTEDGGLTWSVIDNMVLGLDNDPALSPTDTLGHSLDFQSIEAVNDTVAFCALRWNEYQKTGNNSHSGIFKTKDGGQTWMNVSSDLDGDVTTVIEFNGDEGFAGGKEHLYTLSIESDTVTDIFSAMPGDGSDYISDITIIDDNELYIVTTTDSIYKSLDGAASFSKFPTVKGGWDIAKINDTTLVSGGGSNKSYVSTNSGESWNSLGIDEVIWEVPGVINDSVNFLADAAIYKIAVSDLVSGNYTFSVQQVGNNNLHKVHILNDSEMLLVGNDATFLKTNDAGLTWNSIDLPAIPELQDLYEEIDFDGLAMNGEEGFVSFNRFKFVDYDDKDDINWSGGILYTDDNWETWDDLDMAKIGKENEADVTINPNHVDCNGVSPKVFTYEDGVLLAYVKWYSFVGDREDHSRVYKTLDKGKNWTAITEDLGLNIINDIEVLGDTLYIAGKTTLLKSTAANLKSTSEVIEFEDLYPNLDEGEDDNMYINALVAEDDELFVVTSLDSCHRSNDGGTTFTTFSNSKGGNDIYRFDKNSFIILGASGKSWFTNDTTTWMDCQTATTSYAIGGEYNGKIYGLARGVIYTTGVDELDLKTAVPILFEKANLNIAYSPSTIDVISTKGDIERCALYSITGKLVSIVEPNNRICRFNNNEFQPGIYIINSFVEGKRYTNKVAFR